MDLSLSRRLTMLAFVIGGAGCGVLVTVLSVRVPAAIHPTDSTDGLLDARIVTLEARLRSLQDQLTATDAALAQETARRDKGMPGVRMTPVTSMTSEDKSSEHHIDEKWAKPNSPNDSVQMVVEAMDRAYIARPDGREVHELLRGLVSLEIARGEQVSAKEAVTLWEGKLKLAPWESAALLAQVAQSELKFEEVRRNSGIVMASNDAPEYERALCAQMIANTMLSEGHLEEAEHTLQDLVGKFSQSIDVRVRQICDFAKSLNNTLRTAREGDR